MLTKKFHYFSSTQVAEDPLYHQRWRIEEAFKRLKHRLNLEHVSGLSQLSVMQDFAAKVLCDNLQALACLAAAAEEPLPEGRRINHAYPHRKGQLKERKSSHKPHKHLSNRAC
ncbi:transposase [Dickeya dianthicola]|uniref:transposase n=1 Tax=Dickeya dianthicola TaxID=204039 RepID=UPI00190F942D|nr:transposase [Dickeya dianthicola]MBT1460559.1 transposase [Dickeya dianthicola]MBT1489756.1 transposase [Dickeya dianthicola]MCA7002873.1 transposase [Dickeya dianthicola]MCI4029482.1 transposase [Dickeya dianthicola]MCI4175111.1 transposase [Dickeya dianthicola]